MARNNDGFDPRFDAGFQRGFEGEVAGDVAGVEPPPAAERPPAAELVETTSPTVEMGSTPGGINPWLIVVAALGVVLLATGLIAEWVSQSIFTDPNPVSVVDYFVTPLVLSRLAPWFVMAGLASLVGGLLVQTVRWRERDRA